MKNTFYKLSAFAVAVGSAVPCFAQEGGDDISAVATELAGMAGKVATGALVVITAGLAIFGLRWGILKLKSVMNASG